MVQVRQTLRTTAVEVDRSEELLTVDVGDEVVIY